MRKDGPVQTTLKPSPVLVIMGVSGCGKSTMAAALAQRLGWDLGEGDDLHPRANVEKMSAGIPLTDADRGPWLERVAAWIRTRQERHAPAVITCSALKRSYRDRLADPGVVFVHLVPDSDELRRRLDARRNHFMPARLLASQLETLEPLADDEDGLVLASEADAGRLTDEVVTELVRRGVPFVTESGPRPSTRGGRGHGLR
jgi:gluconokinase